jgi:hypothetical protein
MLTAFILLCIGMVVAVIYLWVRLQRLEHSFRSACSLIFTLTDSFNRHRHPSSTGLTRSSDITVEGL